jgi:hypothetical protein
VKLRLVIAAFLCPILSALTLDVTPRRVMADESAVIRADGLQPNERITMQAELVDGAGQFLVVASGKVSDRR